MAGGSFRNSTDLVNEALANLGVLSAGQSTDPEDFNYVQEKLDAIFREIAGLEICFLPDPDNIPGQYFAPLADIVAGECCQKFGSSPDDKRRLKCMGLGGAPDESGTYIEVGAGAAAKILKQMTRGRPTYEPLKTYAF